MRRRAPPAGPVLTGRGLRFAVVVARFNDDITGSLERACLHVLEAHGARAEVVSVPGAFELPFAAQRLARTKRFHGVIALGCILRGATPHDRYIASEVTRGLGQVALQTDLPVLYGVLTPLTLGQARARAGLGKGSSNKGADVARAALEMARFPSSRSQP